MKKENITDNQAIILIVMFLLGSSIILGSGTKAKNDAWFTIALAIVSVIPISIVYARLHYLYSDINLFEINEEVLGRFIGKIVNLTYVWYVFFLAASLFRIIIEFVNVVFLLGTPIFILLLVPGIICVWAAKEGLELLGRIGIIFFILVGFSIVIGIILLIPNLNIANILPILNSERKVIFENVFANFAFPFAEIIIFTMVFSGFETKKSSYKIYILGVLIGGFILFITSLNEILVLGGNRYSDVVFPAYDTLRRINIGDFIQRLEVLVVFTFLLVIFIKITICLIAICKGVTKVFEFNDYKFIVVPIGLLVLNLAYFVNDSILEMKRFGFLIWKYFSFPYQVVFPIIILLVAEIRRLLSKKYSGFQ